MHVILSSFFSLLVHGSAEAQGGVRVNYIIACMGSGFAWRLGIMVPFETDLRERSMQAYTIWESPPQDLDGNLILFYLLLESKNMIP